MMNEMKKLNIEELNNISGGTSAEIDEIMEIIESNPDLYSTYKCAQKSTHSTDAAIESVLFWCLYVEPGISETKSNSYRLINGKTISHSEVCRLLKNFKSIE